MSPEIAFAEASKARGPCAQFVAQWISAQGVAGAPTMREIIRDWMSLGAERGVAKWCEALGFPPCPPGPGTIALIGQDCGGAILGLVDQNRLFVTRTFGNLIVVRSPLYLAAWKMAR